MKTSVAILAAAAGLALAKPEFLNTNFDVVPNQEFVLKFKGCDSGCKIELLNGEPKNLKVVQVLVPKTSGSEASITLSKKFPEDTYAFRIEDADGQVNYSEQFSFEGTVAPSTTEQTSTPVETTTVESTTSAATTTMVTVTSESTSATPSPSTTESESSTRTTSNSGSQTSSSDNDSNTPGAAARVGSSHVALAAAVVAVAGYFL